MLLVAVLCGICCARGFAGQGDFGVGLSTTYDSNVSRTEVNPQADIIHTAYAGFSYRENTADIAARLFFQVERRQYTRETFNNDTAGYIDGSVVWSISPRRFTFTVDNVFRETLVDVRQPDTPSNRTNSNALNTGPDLTFRLSSSNSAILGARYGRNDVQNSNTDTRRYIGYLRGLHALSSQMALSLNLEAARVYFEPGAQTFLYIDREDLYGTLTNNSVKNITALDLGVSRVTPNGGLFGCTPSTTPAPHPCDAVNLQNTRLARLSFTEKLSALSTVQVSYSDQISDTYTDLLAALSSSALPTDPRILAQAGTVTGFVTADLYHSRQAGFVYANYSGQFVYNLRAYGRRVDFVTLPEDFHEKGGDISWTWLRTDATSLNASALVRDRVFDSFVREDKDIGVRAAAILKLNRNLTFTLTMDRTERRSTQPLQSFVDTRAMFLVGLTTGQAYQVQPRRY